jgi:hypothetical protein
MIVELLSVAAVFAGGCLFVRAAGLAGWVVPALGLVMGLCIQLSVGLIQVVTPLTTSPVLTLVATFGLPAAWWLIRWRQGHDVTVPVRYAGLSLALLAAAVPVLRAANLAKWHTDSFTYLMGGAVLADGTYATGVSTHHLTKRLIGLPLIHAPAQLADEYYLRSITPLLAVATLAVLVWFYRQGVHGRLDPRHVAVFSVLGVLLLVSNNRFVFSAFYINAHLLVAVLVLIIAGCGWLLVTRDQPPGALMALLLLAIPALVVTRPETGILAGVAVLPLLLSERVPWRHRASTMVVLGASTVVWQAFTVWVHWERGAEVPLTVSGPLAWGGLLLLGVSLLRWRPLLRHATRLLWLIEGGLWLALAALAARDSRLLVDSVSATVENVVFGAGRWGTSLVILAVLVVGALVFTGSPHIAFLRFPVTVFLPLAFVQAYLRGEAYRVGYGDSLSRMFMHIVPLAVLYVLVAYSSGAVPERWTRLVSSRTSMRETP